MAEQVKELVAIANVGGRTHPQYAEKGKLWDFLMASYRGGMGMQGRDGMTPGQKETLEPHGYYPGLFQWEKENADDYNNRKAITPYRPYARGIVNAFVNFVTKTDPTRKNIKKGDDFLDNVDQGGRTMKAFIRHSLSMQRVLGEYNVLVDMPEIKETPLSKMHQMQLGQRPYCVPVLPQNLVDWSIGNNGLYEWILIETAWYESHIEDDEPKEVKRRTYFDKEVFQVYEESEKGGAWKLVEAKPHPVKEVPMIRIHADDIDTDPATPESWFYDLADLNRAIYNLDSIDIVNFHTQCFGQLILPATGSGDAEAAKIASTSEAWTETEEENGISRYIQPTGIEHTTIEAKILTLRAEMYRLSGLYHKTDSKAAETAEAKAWDHEEMNQFLSAYADTGESLETDIFRLKAGWENSSTVVTVDYNKDFTVQDLEKIIASILDLKQVGYGSEVGRKEALKRAYNQLLDGYVTEKTMRAIEAEIDASEDTGIFENMNLGNEESEK